MSSFKSASSIIFRVIITLVLLYTSWKSWTFAVPLYSTNANYYWLPKSVLLPFFYIYPWANIIACLLLLAVPRFGIPLILVLLLSYFIFSIVPVIRAECAECMISGMLPGWKLARQAMLYGFSFVILLFVYTRPAMPVHSRQRHTRAL